MFPLLGYYLIPVLLLTVYSIAFPPIWLMRPPTEDEVKGGADPEILVRRDTFPNTLSWRVFVIPFSALATLLGTGATDYFYPALFTGAQMTAIASLSFIALSSLPTDFVYRLADRWQLRVALAVTVIASLMDAHLRVDYAFWIGVAMAGLATLLILLKKSVGASDARALQLAFIASSTTAKTVLGLMFGTLILMGLTILTYVSVVSYAFIAGKPLLVKDDKGNKTRASKYKIPAVPIITLSYLLGLVLAVVLNPLT